ncbi:MAG: ATP-binding cassette domain-containing protein [Muribaculaceae bacterium]|jgi:putative ABC transport system ATP-binding protein|nr:MULTISPECIES: ATP-binding cassette domain-containing protein [Bacteroidales]MBJ2192566.1 ATP-binding cassette domain-containing protein [Muribaculaceae bacterium]ROS84332.1 ATP-binding cassette domain-containing protein [Muribaculaceae bacterium Isolate-036 (Harlan)]ROT19567.1 ATP-binding cassette domain-containing protein [Muribaculaceae bacterium Isolate-113 (HZI)]ROT23104.1 ATP-binding cassette domain-containing protein [Muribaculaceae bacterium Isolate-114 (HZI)]RXE65992.1 ATP-binding c
MIKEIRFEGMLPEVFQNERIPESDVWKTGLVLERGEHYLIEAASGGGKSSMCSYIFGSRDDYKGKLLFDSRDVREFTISDWQEIRRRNIAYLPQELDLFPELTAWENIQLKNKLTSHLSDAEIENCLEELGIASRRDYPAGRMSIGQQQRVAIIRSICQPFDFILLDEPVSHLDEDNNRIAAAIIGREAERQGAAIVSTSVGNPLLLDNYRKLRL